MADATGTGNGKRGRTRCHVCANPQIAEIDAALLSTATLAEIASRFGHSDTALSRHRIDCLPASVIRGTARRVGMVQVISPPPTPAEVALFEDALLARVDLIERDADELLAEARANRDTRGAIAANLARLAIAREKRELMPERREESPVVISFSFESPERAVPRALAPVFTADDAPVVAQPDAAEVQPSAEVPAEPEPERMLPPLAVTFGFDGQVKR
jgi:hypothetical protein